MPRAEPKAATLDQVWSAIKPVKRVADNQLPPTAVGFGSLLPLSWGSRPRLHDLVITRISERNPLLLRRVATEEMRLSCKDLRNDKASCFRLFRRLKSKLLKRAPNIHITRHALPITRRRHPCKEGFGTSHPRAYFP